MGSSVFLWASHVHYSTATEPPTLGPTCVHTDGKTATKLCMANQLDVRNLFAGSTTNADTLSVCGSYPSSYIDHRPSKLSGALPILAAQTAAE